jgi:hypothetical protein
MGIKQAAALRGERPEVVYTHKVAVCDDAVVALILQPALGPDETGGGSRVPPSLCTHTNFAKALEIYRLPRGDS